MTDEQLNTLELEIAEGDYIAVSRPRRILGLIAELRQARAERDWLAKENRYAPCELGRKCLHPDGRFICDSAKCWLELAAKEATCQKN